MAGTCRGRGPGSCAATWDVGRAQGWSAHDLMFEERLPVSEHGTERVELLGPVHLELIRRLAVRQLRVRDRDRAPRIALRREADDHDAAVRPENSHRLGLRRGPDL